jgi:hypothetical protein
MAKKSALSKPDGVPKKRGRPRKIVALKAEIVPEVEPTPKVEVVPKVKSKKVVKVPNVDTRYDFSDDVEANLELMTTKPAFLTRKGLANNQPQKKIRNHWAKIIESAKMGYEIGAIAKAIGVHRKTLWLYMKSNPQRKVDFDNAQNATRDLCVNVILDAAKKGNWIPAAWWLERTRGMEFAKPEVKLQFWDRQMSNDQVEQRIAGKTLAEISSELSKQYQSNDNVQKYVDGSGRLPVGKNESEQPVLPVAEGEDGSSTNT